MIDKFVGVYAGRKYSGTDDNYRPSEAIESRRVVNESAPNLTVLFPPWRGGESAYNLLTKRLVKSSSAVLQYKFSPQILEPNVSRVVESFERIQSEVTEDLEKLTFCNRYDQVNFVASSLGNVSLGLVAKRFPEFTGATMIVAGSNLARSAWEGSRTQHIRQALELQGMSEDALDEAWAKLAPKNSATAFEGKPVHLLVSTTDEVIPAHYQHEMVDTVSSAGVIATVDSYRTGHIATVARYCLSEHAKLK